MQLGSEGCLAACRKSHRPLHSLTLQQPCTFTTAQHRLTLRCTLAATAGPRRLRAPWRGRLLRSLQLKVLLQRASHQGTAQVGAADVWAPWLQARRPGPHKSIVHVCVRGGLHLRLGLLVRLYELRTAGSQEQCVSCLLDSSGTHSHIVTACFVVAALHRGGMLLSGLL